ncbi:hypothetical protein [Undibacterium flavidum]|uniref:Uncharacterized protein n=1 Tax=Undibacterium flavidum TaxID=2762297 RepID=A0ABR6YA35_9BURK|nr:hypothetical protein [Undibacterium flavidum]MBC3873491.1 hypothetical protein [Undibacterium flavidum]
MLNFFSTKKKYYYVIGILVSFCFSFCSLAQNGVGNTIVQGSSVPKGPETIRTQFNKPLVKQSQEMKGDAYSDAVQKLMQSSEAIQMNCTILELRLRERILDQQKLIDLQQQRIDLLEAELKKLKK